MSQPRSTKPADSPAVRSLKKEQNKQAHQTPKEKEEELVRGLKDSFPASDPVAVTSPTTAGEAPDKKKGDRKARAK
ncbi:MAG: hypothetical protein WBA44_07015 [Mesorhizobium sp.]